MFNQKEFLSKIKATVRQHDAQATVILFGSRARGDARTDSDWDVLVLTNCSVTADFKRKIISAIYDLELEYLQPVSIIIRNKQQWEDWAIMPLYKNVVSEGVSL